jgi:hypothetical protein
MGWFPSSVSRVPGAAGKTEVEAITMNRILDFFGARQTPTTQIRPGEMTGRCRPWNLIGMGSVRLARNFQRSGKI